MTIKKDKATLDRILGNIERSRKYDRDNRERYNKFRDFVYKSTISPDQKTAYGDLDKSYVEVNIVEAHLNRLREDFARKTPGITVMVQDGIEVTDELTELRKTTEGHIKYVVKEADANGTQQGLIQEIASGGFSSSKVYAKYKEGQTFNQVIVWEKVNETTSVGFDILSREVSRKDAEYCFELFTQSKEKVEKEYKIKIDEKVFGGSYDGGVKWFTQIEGKEVVVIADYYEIQYEHIDIVRLSSGEDMTKKEYQERKDKYDGTTEKVPDIFQERSWPKKKVIRYNIIGDTILSAEEVDGIDALPYVFFDGNSVLLYDKSNKPQLMTRPYLYNSVGPQQLYNNLASELADQSLNLSNQKLMIAKESIDPEFRDNIIHPKSGAPIVWQARDNNNPELINPKPEQLARTAFPVEMFALFQYVPRMLQHTLGSSNAQAGISETELSGRAIIQSSINSSKAAEPAIGNYTISLNRVAEMILKLIPSVHLKTTSLPIIDDDGLSTHVQVNSQGNPSLKFDPLLFKIKVDAGPSDQVQQAQSIAQISQLCRDIPGFGEFIGEDALSVVIENMTVRGSDTLKILLRKFTQKKEMMKQAAIQNQQGAQDPRVMREETRKEQMMLDAEKDKADIQIDTGKLALDQEEIDLKKKELVAKALTEDAYLDLERQKIESVTAEKVIQAAMEDAGQDHKHRMDHIDREHRTMQSHHRITGRPHFTHE